MPKITQGQEDARSVLSVRDQVYAGENESPVRCEKGQARAK